MSERDDDSIVLEDTGEASGVARNAPKSWWQKRREKRANRIRIGLRLSFVLLALAAAVGIASMALTGRTLHLPVWAVAEIEERLNKALSATQLPKGTAVTLGEIEIALERDLSPRFLLRDLRLIEPSGQSLVVLPEIRASLAPGDLMTGQLRPAQVRVTGARLAIARDLEGRLVLNLGGGSDVPQVQNAAELLDAVDHMFSTPLLSKLTLIEGEGLGLTLRDARAGRSWEVGDGRLVIENREDAVAGELSLTLLDGATPAQARVAIESGKADSSAKLWANFDQLAAADLAAQAPPLAPLALLDAPISGNLYGVLMPNGAVGPFEGRLTVTEGKITPPDGGGRPIAFESAALALRYDPERQRVTLDELTVESASARLRGRGTSDLLDGEGQLAEAGEWPSQLISQLDLDELMVDPEGLFEEAVRFTSGAATVRLTLNPFKIDIGDVSLKDGADVLSLRGEIGAVEGGGWQGAVDVGVSAISADRLMKLWPVSAVPKTRKWLAENVGQGELSDVTAALRIFPDREPRFALDYKFTGAEVRFIRTLPPVQDGHGRSSIFGNVYTVVIEGGHVKAPRGGDIDVTGSVFQVLDILQKPAQAEVNLHTKSSLTAALSLMDQEPFRFITKANQSVDLGVGETKLVTVMRFPLVAKLPAKDISYSVEGEVFDFRSDQLVKGKTITAERVAIEINPRGLKVTGRAALDGVAVDGTYAQAFGPEAGGKAQLTGEVGLSDEALRTLGVRLPQGWLSGRATAAITIDLARGAAPLLRLSSNLQGMGLRVSALGWSKGRDSRGKLDLTARLGARPEVTKLKLEAAGLTAEGQVTTLAGGGLERASFSRLRLGSWLDVTGEARGQRGGVSLKVTGGQVDLRAMPKDGELGQSGNGGGSGGLVGQIEVNLDRLIASEGISLTGLSGAFTPKAGGIDGRFVSSVNGRGRITSTAVPVRGGTAIRITSSDAGQIMAAAGVFDKGSGGDLDLTLQPRGTGRYAGQARFTNLSMQNAPALAEMLSAASVVGLLEQLNGQGIHFSEGDVDFEIKPEGVQIARGAAVGASMGISFEGFYRASNGSVDIQGTISPIYLLNGIGQIFARRGEGLFGFNYHLSGSASSPRITVNPLSILTPGMFRDIFRRPAPVLEDQG